MGAGRGADPSPGARRLGQSLATPPPCSCCRLASHNRSQRNLNINLTHGTIAARSVRRSEYAFMPNPAGRGPWAGLCPTPRAVIIRPRRFLIKASLANKVPPSLKAITGFLIKSNHRCGAADRTCPATLQQSAPCAEQGPAAQPGNPRLPQRRAQGRG